MPRKRHKPEEIVAKLRQVDVLVSQGQSVADAVRSIGVTEVTYYRWKPWTAAKPKPVAAIRSAAASSAGRRLTRCAVIPRASVRRAEPRSAAVAMAPTANASKPRSERWTGSKMWT